MMDNKKSFTQYLLLLIISVLSSCNARTQSNNCDKKDTLNYIPTQNGCLYVRTFKSDSIGLNSNLLIVIHGDTPFNPPSYQYKLSKKISEQVKNTVIASILRPGYKDNEGNKSDGKRGLTTGDNYTEEVINSLTSVIKELKNRFKPSRTLIIGHSGGAAISANIVSLTPNLADKAILVSCPCDVEAFRKSMALKQPFYGAWGDSVKSISPINIINKLDIRADITLIHGQQDDIVPFEIAETYYEQLKSYNIKTKMIKVENARHEILLSDTVISIIKSKLIEEQNNRNTTNR